MRDRPLPRPGRQLHALSVPLPGRGFPTNPGGLALNARTGSGFPYSAINRGSPAGSNRSLAHEQDRLAALVAKIRTAPERHETAGDLVGSARLQMVRRRTQAVIRPTPTVAALQHGRPRRDIMPRRLEASHVPPPSPPTTSARRATPKRRSAGLPGGPSSLRLRDRDGGRIRRFRCSPCSRKNLPCAGRCAAHSFCPGWRKETMLRRPYWMPSGYALYRRPLSDFTRAHVTEVCDDSCNQ